MPKPKFTPVRDRPGWSRSETGGQSDAIEEVAKTLNGSRPPHTYFVCGCLPDDAGHRLYQIETPDPLEIIQAFEVGARAELSYGENVLPAVLEQMAAVHSHNPIVPFFADAAGLKCTFEEPITEEFGDFLDSMISEGGEIYEDEGSIGVVVQETKFLHLWWD
jgi:hypothetical protein